jgi:hypothetical protein
LSGKFAAFQYTVAGPVARDHQDGVGLRGLTCQHKVIAEPGQPPRRTEGDDNGHRRANEYPAGNPEGSRGQCLFLVRGFLRVDVSDGLQALEHHLDFGFVFGAQQLIFR